MPIDRSRASVTSAMGRSAPVQWLSLGGATAKIKNSPLRSATSSCNSTRGTVANRRCSDRPDAGLCTPGWGPTAQCGPSGKLVTVGAPNQLGGLRDSCTLVRNTKSRLRRHVACALLVAKHNATVALGAGPTVRRRLPALRAPKLVGGLIALRGPWRRGLKRSLRDPNLRSQGSRAMAGGEPNEMHATRVCAPSNA